MCDCYCNRVQTEICGNKYVTPSSRLNLIYARAPKTRQNCEKVTRGESNGLAIA